MNKIILFSVMLLTSCSLMAPKTPKKAKKRLTYAQQRPELMQRCMERFLAHGVPFNDIVKACDERIYKNKQE